VGDGAGAAGYTTVRPDSEVTGKKNFSGDGGATPVYSRMNDNNDATYGAGSAGGPPGTAGYPGIWYAMGMGNIAPPATARVYRLRTRARYFRDTTDSGHNEKVSLTPRCPGTKHLVSSPRDYYETGSTTVQEKYGVWRNHDPDGREWTASRVNGTQLEIYGYKNNVGVGYYLRVVEVYMDVDIREKPTVSGVTVTGASTTRPTVDWTFNTNPDGDNQYWYRIKMFTAAQYGAAGFNAETSAAFWDSGQVASSSNSVIIGADLQNGVTYKAYVKAAQSFHSTPWYTDWALSSTFTVALGPPADPTMSVAMDDTLQRAVLTIAANQNMLSADDSDFEATAGTWTVLSNCAAVRSLTFFANGIASLRLTSTAGGDMSATMAGDITPLVAGRTYTLHVRCRAAAAGPTRTFQLSIDWKNAAGGTISTNLVSGTNNNTNFTTTGVSNFTAPAGTRSGRLKLVILATAAGAEVHYFDMVGIWPGTSTAWTSGGQQSATAMLLEYLDASLGSRNLLPNQIATCGVATHSTAGFTGRTATDDVDFDDAVVSADGQGSIRWTTGTTTSNLDIGLQEGAPFDATYAFPVVAGKTYMVSFDIKAGVSFSSQLYLIFYKQDGTFISQVGQTMTVTTSFVRYGTSGTAPAGAAWARATVENTASASSVNVWVARGIFRENGTTADIWVPGQADQRAWREFLGWGSVVAKNLALDEFQEELVYDYGLPRGRPRLYRLRAINSITGQPVGSTNYAYVSAQITSDGKWYLIDPYHPWLNLVIKPTEFATTIEEGLEVVHDLGNDRPIVMADRIYGEDSASFEIYAAGVDGIRAVKDIIKEQHTLISISHFTDRQWPIRLISRSEQPFKTPRGAPASKFSLGYVEVEAP
jgi:hypothetical protein